MYASDLLIKAVMQINLAASASPGSTSNHVKS